MITVQIPKLPKDIGAGHMRHGPLANARFMMSAAALSAASFLVVACAPSAAPAPAPEEAVAEQPVTTTEAAAPTEDGNNVVEDCAEGAGKAVGVTVLMTAGACVVDLFITGGATCATVFVPAATASAPYAAGGGCVVGAVMSPDDATAYTVPTSPTPIRPEDGAAPAPAPSDQPTP